MAAHQDIPQTLTDNIILDYKPQDLGSIETELIVPPPRSQEWFTKDGNLSKKEKLNAWIAIRGWVCQSIETPDLEGPDHHIILAWILDGKLHHKYTKIGYDLYSWIVAYPDHYKWFMQTMKPGNPLTLLYNPDNTSEATIFGQHEPFVMRDGALVWAAA